MNFLAAILIISSSAVSAFWNGNNAVLSPFGPGTGYYNQAPWGGNSNFNPFSETGGRWNPRNDAANLSRYGARPAVLIKYKEDPAFQPRHPMRLTPKNRVKPTNWLLQTDFASTLRGVDENNKNFIVNDNFPMFNLPGSYTRAKAGTLGLSKVFRAHVPSARHQNGATDNTYGKQDYRLSPAAISTNRVK